ncbi:MAG: YckD family protein [Acidimicrobiia bacterium]|nr:YckD family protein [Acidimicrobiia bacterium]
MRKIIVSLAAAGVLVAGAFVASSVTGSAAEAQTAEDNATEQVERPAPGSILEDVLSELVADGTITQDQADAVKEALEAKHEEMKENRPDGPERRKHRRRAIMRHRVMELLDDGVISADEIAELPDGHPFKDADGPFAELIEDGQITQAEWDDFVAERKAEHEANRSSAETSSLNA